MRSRSARFLQRDVSTSSAVDRNFRPSRELTTRSFTPGRRPRVRIRRSNSESPEEKFSRWQQIETNGGQATWQLKQQELCADSILQLHLTQSERLRIH